MARLEFAGARYVRNYHLAVPHHELEIDKKKSLSKTPGLEDNLIIRGDNLKALKSLLPHFAGRIKCIYIDPPYNTGNENWVYNDNVNSPRHKDWLNKVVDKDCQDRHDRWLSMMMPRLKLLRELLRDDGVIFISIDDNEVHRLRMLLDEIFGERNFVAELIVQSNPKGRVLQPNFATTHEYVLCYSKAENDHSYSIEKSDEQVEREYPEEDEKGPFRWMELRNTHREFTPENRKNLWYSIYANRKTGAISLEPTSGSVEIKPMFEDGSKGVWTWGKPAVEKEIDQLKAWQVGNEWKVFRKARVTKKKLKSLLIDSSFATEKGMQAVEQIFGNRPFQNPKSPFLLSTLFQSCTEESDIILDSFAGSGTTAHAVLALNKEDGGNRKFILVEQEDYADTITAERVRRVIKGVKGAPGSAHTTRGIEPLSGSFTYVTLGQEFDMEKMLSGENLPSYETMAAYCYLTAIGKPWDQKQMRKRERFIGTSDEYDVYLFYEPDVEKLKSKDLALSLYWAEEQEEAPKKKKLVFAPVRFVSRENMEKYGLEYCQLPYEIYRKVEEKPAANTEKKK
jgi:adenine-specific DNA-methyltransferase